MTMPGMAVRLTVNAATREGASTRVVNAFIAADVTSKKVEVYAQMRTTDHQLFERLRAMILL